MCCFNRPAHTESAKTASRNGVTTTIPELQIELLNSEFAGPTVTVHRLTTLHFGLTRHRELLTAIFLSAHPTEKVSDSEPIALASFYPRDL